MFDSFLPVGSAPRSRTRQDETHTVLTKDGWRLSLLRYRPRGLNPSREPVLLHHGLGSTADIFDFGLDRDELPTPSLAQWLADRGYDVWTCDLRGNWRTSLLNGHVARWDWSVDDLVCRDDVALVQYILKQTNRARLHWIGHSLGGILLLCYSALHGSPRLASGIAVGAGLDGAGTGSFYRYFAPLRGIAAHLGRMPLSWISQPLAPLAGHWDTIFERINYVPANVSPAGAQAVHRMLQDVSGRVLAQLATLFRPGGFRSLDGRIRYAALAKRIGTPILLAAGEKDRQFPPSSIMRTLALLRGSQHAAAFFGRSHGQAEDYGHLDLLVGLRAEREVYPHFLSWLKAHPAAA
jgi:pimeloyl-ACP methyl ester carboxylesterase